MPDSLRRQAILDALSGKEKAATSEIARLFNRYTKPRELPPRPGIFLPDPSVVGSPHLAQLANRVLNQSPEVKARLKSIVAGPTRAVIKDLEQSGLAPEQYGETNLLGETDLPTRTEVSINPALSREEQAATLMHELTHVAGEDYETTPRLIKKLYLKLVGAQP